MSAARLLHPQTRTIWERRPDVYVVKPGRKLDVRAQSAFPAISDIVD